MPFILSWADKINKGCVLPAPEAGKTKALTVLFLHASCAGMKVCVFIFPKKNKEVCPDSRPEKNKEVAAVGL